MNTLNTYDTKRKRNGKEQRVFYIKRIAEGKSHCKNQGSRDDQYLII